MTTTSPSATGRSREAAADPARVVVDIRDVHKNYGLVEVLKGVDLQVRVGEVTVVLGPSGSGKSTLLRCINHLEKVKRGTVTIDGELIGYRRAGDRLHELREREVLRQRTHIGFVFQNFNLFPHLTVVDNLIEAPVSALGVPRARAQERRAAAGARRPAGQGGRRASTATLSSSSVNVSPRMPTAPATRSPGPSTGAAMARTSCSAYSSSTA
ncbi:hypothetical protein GCM10010390_64930 [Streptomyces mordarskii]|uniref:ABC transporter domain-containing protein n=1 Tax=Streptomyces mordarskii TaxID=1226758 RepID=A0ABN1DW68_9ACTN